MSLWRWIMLWFYSFTSNHSSLQWTSRDVDWGSERDAEWGYPSRTALSVWSEDQGGHLQYQYPYFTICCWYWIFRCGVWPCCESTRNVWGTICVLCHTWKHRFWAEKVYYDLGHLLISLFVFPQLAITHGVFRALICPKVMEQHRCSIMCQLL